MGIERFLDELFESGSPHVPAAPEWDIAAETLRRVDDQLRRSERTIRLDMPGEPPPFSIVAARWGGVLFYQACQFLVHRDAEAQRLALALSAPCPEPMNPSTVYSVDLTMRFLPDVSRLAKAANPDDSLVKQLTTLGGDWPLSSVGVPGVAPKSLRGILEHPCLLTLYVDRIIATRDVARLAERRVQEAVRQAVGIHRDLFAELDAVAAQEEAAV